MKQRSFFKSGRHLLFGMLAGLVPLTGVYAEGTYNQGQGMQERSQYGHESDTPAEPRGAQGPMRSETMRSETMSSEQFAERQRDMLRIQQREEQTKKELSHLPFWKEYEHLNN